MKLYPHQQKALKQCENQNRVAFYHDMGLGKTFTGAEKMNRLGTVTNLIICQKSKINDWKDHIETHYPQTKVLDLTEPNKIDEFVSHHVAWNGYHGGTPNVGIINYELAWRRSRLLELEDFTLLLDESSLIQNSKAKQSKFVLKLKPANVILLSGTPTAGKYENLWTQLKLLGWDITEKTYNAIFVNWKTQKIGWMNPKIIKVVDKVQPYKNIERLKQEMRDHGAQFLKTEECFELPEQTFIEINVSKHPKYKKFMETSFVNLGDDIELVGDTSLTKRLYARMLCGQYNAAKYESFKTLLESTNDRIIVFYNFNNEMLQLRRICEQLNKPVSICNGLDKDFTAYENEDDSVTLIQYQAGAMGLNLQKANKVVYFTLPERSELFEQSKKRIHRIGQKQPCFYYIMLADGTIERDIYKTLQQRKDYTDELFRKGCKNV